MRLLVFIFTFLACFNLLGQGLEPSQIQGAARMNDILQAKNMYIDEYGDTLYIYQHTTIEGIVKVDSIFLRNDTIFLRDGKGFAKITASSNPQDLFPYLTGFILDNPTIPLQDTVLFNYAASGGGTFVPASNYIAGTGIDITGNVISSTVVNTDNQNLSYGEKTGSSIPVNISGGTGVSIIQGTGMNITRDAANQITFNSAVSNTDAQAISKTGNVISITGNASTVNISQTATPADGNVLTWNSGQWNAAAPAAGGGITIQDNINGSAVFLSSTMTSITSLSLGAGTWLVNGIAQIYTQNNGIVATLELFNSSNSTVLFTQADDQPGGTNSSISVAKAITLGSTSTIQLRASFSGSATVFVPASRGVITAIK